MGKREVTRTWGQWWGAVGAVAGISAVAVGLVVTVVYAAITGLVRLGILGVSLPAVPRVGIYGLAVVAGIACVAGAVLRPRIVSGSGRVGAGRDSGLDRVRVWGADDPVSIDDGVDLVSESVTGDA